MLFLYGTLRHPPLLAAVLGRMAEPVPARLDGWHVVAAEGQPFPLILAGGGPVDGALVGPLSADEVARLDFYETGAGFDLHAVTVVTDAGPVSARMYAPRPGRWPEGGAWSLADFVARWADLAVPAAVEFMDLWPGTAPETAAAMYPQILQRVDSRRRAAADPQPRGRRLGRGMAEVLDRRRPYRQFFELVEAELRFPLFSGAMSAPVSRAAFVGGDAATVLPYDPVRDRVLVIEQFRFAPFIREDPIPWTLEPVAGRIDGGETPEATARREALEEAGLALDRLILVARGYPSPGAVTDYIYSFIGLADLPDGAAGLGGLADEAEDIRAQILSFDALMALVDAGRIDTAPLHILALELARRRDGLRA